MEFFHEYTCLSGWSLWRPWALNCPLFQRRGRRFVWNYDEEGPRSSWEAECKLPFCKTIYYKRLLDPHFLLMQRQSLFHQSQQSIPNPGPEVKWGSRRQSGETQWPTAVMAGVVSCCTTEPSQLGVTSGLTFSFLHEANSFGNCE